MSKIQFVDAAIFYISFFFFAVMPEVLALMFKNLKNNAITNKCVGIVS